jgi:hypothetical protein
MGDVVDENYKVYNTKNLYIGDLSAAPGQFAGSTGSCSMVIGHLAGRASQGENLA